MNEGQLKRLEDLESFVKSQGDWKKKFEECQDKVASMLNEGKDREEWYNSQLKTLEDRLTIYSSFKQVMDSMFGSLILEALDKSPLKREVEELGKRFDSIPKTVQEYRGTEALADLTLEEKREPLVLDMNTVRGQILRLILDGFLDTKRSAPQISRELFRQFIKTDRGAVDSELAWYVTQRILDHEETDRHVYWLRIEAKDRVRRVVKE